MVLEKLFFWYFGLIYIEEIMEFVIVLFMLLIVVVIGVFKFVDYGVSFFFCKK